VVYAKQRSLIFYPQARAYAASEHTRRLRLPDAELVLTVQEQAGKRALIYFGGNAEDVSLSLADLATAFPEHSLYLPHYRGYGGSTGEPGEKALVADALALYADVAQRHQEITVIGRSLGSGVAVQLAAARPVARLVLVTPYDSLLGIAERQFPYLPVRWLMRDPFESSRHALRITAPTTIIEAEHDEVIARASTERLYASFRPGVASYHRLAGTDHNSVSSHPDYYALLRGR
jgi:pimeloyl-ACP methyl ester carboxylesterase